jgi:hypothetical protein
MTKRQTERHSKADEAEKTGRGPRRVTLKRCFNLQITRQSASHSRKSNRISKDSENSENSRPGSVMTLLGILSLGSRLSATMRCPSDSRRPVCIRRTNTSGEEALH